MLIFIASMLLMISYADRGAFMQLTKTRVTLSDYFGCGSLMWISIELSALCMRTLNCYGDNLGILTP